MTLTTSTAMMSALVPFGRSFTRLPNGFAPYHPRSGRPPSPRFYCPAHESPPCSQPFIRPGRYVRSGRVEILSGRQNEKAKLSGNIADIPSRSKMMFLPITVCGSLCQFVVGSRSGVHADNIKRKGGYSSQLTVRSNLTTSPSMDRLAPRSLRKLTHVDEVAKAILHRTALRC